MAAYDNSRQLPATVLAGFQQVEDNLRTCILEKEQTHNSVRSSLPKNTWSWPSLVIEAV